MLFYNYLPGLPVHKTAIEDRLVQDSSNETLRTFLKLSDAITRDFYSNNPDLEEKSLKLIQDLKNNKNEFNEEFYTKYPEFKEELQFYFSYQKDINLLRIYIESSDKVKKVAKGWFHKE